MTLIRFVQRASILAGITFAGVAFHGSSATAQAEKFCVVASNGKTACGTLKAVERACVSTDNGVVCGKFKSVATEQGQEAAKPAQEKIVNNFAFSLKICSKSDTTVKCNFSVRNKGAAREFIVSTGDVTITDSSGKNYKASTVELGGKSSWIGSVKTVPEVDYEMVLTFDNIPEGVRKIQVLSFLSEGKAVNLRNITFAN